MSHPTTASHPIELLYSLRDEIDKREEPVILATVVKEVGSNPQKVGARMVLFQDGSIRGTVGGGRIESHIIKDGLDMFSPDAETHQLLEYNLQEIGMTCGGLMVVFLERIDVAPHVVLFGGGHVSAPTAKLAAEVGFKVTVVDERTEWANKERFPSATIINESFPNFLKTFTPRAHHYLVLVSQGHAHDQKILEQVMGGPQRFTGMIGSKKKAWSMWKHFRKLGIAEDIWNQVHCPIGIPLGESQPAEIAVSIVAQLIQVRYQSQQTQSQQHKTG